MKLSSLDSDQKSAKQISEEANAESELILIQHEKTQHNKIQRKKYNTRVQRLV